VKIALSLSPVEEQVRFARQLGIRYVVSALPASPTGYLDYQELVLTRSYFREAGLSWDVIENLPAPHYDKVMFGPPGRDEQIEGVRTTIRNMGRAGIEVLQYQWMLLGGLRTEYSPTGRGGARYSRFDLSVAERSPAAALDWLGHAERYPRIPERDLSERQVWDNLIYFLQCVVPVAEEAGVKLAVHPDDAPIPSFMGVARILVTPEALQRVIDAVPSPNNGLGFCQGTVATMAGVNVIKAIRHFGRQGKIFFAHFRNPRGQVPYFDEVFPDEGDTDLLQAVRAYQEVGYDGVIRIDHCPGVVGDNRTADRSFAFQVGYMRGLVHHTERSPESAPTPASGPGPQLALSLDPAQDRDLIYAQQLGVEQIVAAVDRWDQQALAGAANRVRKAGLKLAAIESLPSAMYTRAILGLPGRDEEIAAVCDAIRAAGAAGAPLVSYRWTPPGIARTGCAPEGRGEALVPVYDAGRLAEAPPAEVRVTADEMWANLAYFLKAMLPVAEEADVRLACHPDDPPAPSYPGAARILTNVTALKRLLDVGDSAHHGLDLCLGTIAAIPGVDVLEVLRYFGQRRKVFMLHLRNVQGRMPCFRQAFLDESDISLTEVLALCRAVGFTGPIRAAAPPGIVGDTPWGHKGRALDLGYLRALLQAAECG